MIQIGKIYLEFQLNAITELELIYKVKEYIDTTNKRSNLLIKIIRLNTKTKEHLIAPELLKEFIELHVDNYINLREHFALIILKEHCELLINKQTTPYKLWSITKSIEEQFDFPEWLGELYDTLDWSEPDTKIESHMIKEAQQRVTAINHLLSSEYFRVVK